MTPARQSAEAARPASTGGVLVVKLGNRAPQHQLPDGTMAPVERVGSAPTVTTLAIPTGPVGRLIGIDQRDGESDEDFAARDAAHLAETTTGPIYTVGHDGASLPADLQRDLDALDPLNLRMRRLLIDDWLKQSADAHNPRGLPGHEALVAIIDPRGVWANHSTDDPTWVSATGGGPGAAEFVESMLALYFDCPIGVPASVEDTHWTFHGTGTYPPGAAPPPDIVALHTSYGRDFQALLMGGMLGYLGTVGTATAATATTLTGSAESGISHAANDCAGQLLVVSANAAGTGSKVYGLIKSNTSGTTPVYTVDRWYAPDNPGGAAGTTPNATSLYQVVLAGPACPYVGLSTDTTAKSIGGANGTADATAIGTALTGEIATAGGGLIRKIGVLAHSAGAATWTNTPVFTANGSDALPVTVGTASSSPSIVAQAVTHMSLVSPTATLSASGDQLTLTVTYTES